MAWRTTEEQTVWRGLVYRQRRDCRRRRPCKSSFRVHFCASGDQRRYVRSVVGKGGINERAIPPNLSLSLTFDLGGFGMCFCRPLLTQADDIDRGPFQFTPLYRRFEIFFWRSERPTLYI